MKITNISQGESYELSPDAQLSIERTNPFFHEWGEQSAPIDLPDTGRNRRLLGLDNFLATNRKASTTIETSIEDGDYYAICRQAVLGLQRDESIKTSFYLNEGSFYARLNETTLQDVFKNETVPGVSSVQEGIDFCRGLVTNQNEQYGIFPVLIRGENTGEYKWLNRYGTQYYPGDALRKDVYWNDVTSSERNGDFYNAIAREEKSGEDVITLAAGYYMSPFLKLPYVLQCVFSHLGYTLKDNLFTFNEQLKKICIINNVMDVMMTGKINLEELLPQRTCNEFLNTIRKKFCCEFIPNEIERSITVQFFNDILDTKTVTTDLTQCITSKPNVEFSTYKHVVLSAKEKVGSSKDFKNIENVIAKYPTLSFSPADGCFHRIGFKGLEMTTNRITDSSMPYDVAGTDLDACKIEIDECVPTQVQYGVCFNPYHPYYIEMEVKRLYLYIGEAQALHSYVEKADEEQRDFEYTDYPIMMAFAYHGNDDYPNGIVTNYALQKRGITSWWDPVRIGEYSLCYYGEDGIYNRFYRQLDLLHRNALHKVRADLLLSQQQKMKTSSFKKVLMNNVEYLIDTLTFSLGGKNEPVESTFLSTTFCKPTDAPGILVDIPLLDLSTCQWVAKKERIQISEKDYNEDVKKEAALPTVYPPLVRYSLPGQRYCTSYNCIKVEVSSELTEYYKVNYWLELKS